MVDADQVTGDEKVRKLFGGNYRKLQAIKAKYEQVLPLRSLLFCQISPTAQISCLESGSLSNPWLDTRPVSRVGSIYYYRMMLPL
jgi:hypothetical protein